MNFTIGQEVGITQNEWMVHGSLVQRFGDDAGVTTFTIQFLNEDDGVATLLNGPDFQIIIPIGALT